jgi:hypothetical protein
MAALFLGRRATGSTGADVFFKPMVLEKDLGVLCQSQRVFSGTSQRAWEASQAS